MNFTSLFRHGLSALSMAMLIGVSAFGQTVATVPVGAVTVTIAAGTGSSRVLTPVSLPLLTSKVATGQITGRMTAVTSNTISNSNAGWGSGALSTKATPSLIQITSGLAAGRIFLISTSVANTSTSLTIDSSESSLVDLSTLGIVTGGSGDTYRLLECDTLSSVFSNVGVQGGSSSSSADIVQVLTSGSFAEYYYNTTSGSWIKRALGNPNSDALPLKPDAVILYNRIATTSLPLTLTGDVPPINRISLVGNSGITVLSTFWPVDSQLSALGIQNIAGWKSSATLSQADLVSVFVGGSWAQYFHNGTSWRKVALGSPLSDSLPIPAGAGVIITKRGAVSGVAVVNQNIPYSL